MSHRHRMAWFAALLLSALACSAPVRAADIVVETSSDGPFLPIGRCTLRDAVAAANTDAAVGECNAGSGADRILFDGVDGVTLRSALPAITRTLTFDGRGSLVTIRRLADAEPFRILQSEADTTLTLRHVAITGGLLIDGEGGGILALGPLVLEDSRVSGNTTEWEDAKGGGIRGYDVQLLRSEVSGNTSRWHGGGIYASTVVLVDSRIDGNTAETGFGGGVLARLSLDATRSQLTGNVAGGIGGGAFAVAATLVDSVLSDNTAGISGGGMLAEERMDASGTTVSDNTAEQAGGLLATILQLRNCTVSGNVALLAGGGIAGEVVSIQNSTITGNGAGDNATGGIVALMRDGAPRSLAISSSIVFDNLGDIGTLSEPVFVAGGRNVIGPVPGNVDVPADTLVCDPALAPLADNGGPTPTHAIAAASCALDAGDNPFDLPTDQRGEARTAGLATDIGAYELQLLAVFADGFED